ncbi:MAG: Asparagine--tRNA ligase [Lentisphaerae bacterium ADurb.BinA184]|nr:MAG: Asparagine--tRNA ligase [Lentisphaerae bacterium ADurb.BinA184]
MDRQLIKHVLKRRDWGARVTVCGWVRTRRDSKGGFSFIELNDGSCLANLQVLADGSLPNYAADVPRLHPGAAIRVAGELRASPGSGQALELFARELVVFGFCEPADYPLQKQRISFERLREVAHLRPRTNTFGAVLRVRNTLARATHNFFQSNDFYYLNTPIITASDCEGAGEMFQVTTLDLDALPRTPEGRIDYAQDFFGKKTGLTVSGQLEGETYACALGRIYTFGPTFRAENSNTRRHLAEFWMIEPEAAFFDLDDNAALAEAYLKHLFAAVLDECGEDLTFFNDRIDKTLLDTLNTLRASHFSRMTYSEAVACLEKSGRAFEFPVAWGAELQSEHERYLAEEHCKGPVIVTDYPATIKPFYMRLSDDARTVAAMDVLVPGVGEIIGGSQREERLDVITARMNASGLQVEDYGWFLDLRRFGSVPHAGFGLGFERMVQFCTGMQNIRDVIPFPRVPKWAEF